MKIYCSCCDKVQSVRIDNCRDEKTNEPFQDIVCAKCDLVIASGTDIQRKPLTDEEIWDEVKAADLDWQTGWSLDEDASNRYITFARAIEAAHGIKEKRND